MRPPQGFEWLLILFIILLLFGAKRLPDMARGLGRSLRILTAETRGMADDDAAQQQSAVTERTAEPPASQPSAHQSDPAPRATQSDSAPRATGDTTSA